MSRALPKRTKVAIVGSGFSGLCAGIQLREAGVTDFVIFEKDDRLGGTWRDNRYPGACCDVPSMFYCFSFEQKTDWPRIWSPQSEIIEYMEHCASKYGVREQIWFGREVEGARWDESANVWRVRTTQGDELEAEILISGVGQLHRPVVPDLPGLGQFPGVHFHSAQWPADADLRGKKVAVVGNAASAIQFIPEIAKEAAELVIFQRTPNWMVERGDRAYTDAERRRFARHPWLTKLYRTWIWASAELFFYPAMRGNRVLSAMLEKRAREALQKHISDPELRRALTPDYPIGGKRVLISDDYYPTLRRENVRLVTSGVERIEGSCVIAADGRAHEADVLIFATGFDTTHFLSPMKLEGAGGRSLDDAWQDGAEAYLGLTLPGFPNFFMMYGPTTNLGHNSIIFMIECQTRYIVDCAKRILGVGNRGGGQSGALDLKPEAMRDYNARIQRDLEDTAWAKTDRSWYKNAAGRITNNWPYSTLRYWWETRRVTWSHYRSLGR